MSDAARYLCIGRLDGSERVFLWEGEDPGPACVVVDQDGFIVVFPSEEAAREVEARWVISPEEASTYDFDAVEEWCRSDADVRDCSQLLNTWNLLIDLPRVENLFRAADSRAINLYDKVFRACNLPSMTPPDEHYKPVWTTSELTSLKHLLLLGIAELRARMR